MNIVQILMAVVTSSTPLVFACLGEMITEQAGVINLAAEGTILMAAMTGFGVAKGTDSVLLGFGAAAAVGAAIALVLAFGSITLKQSQVAIGFVLTMLCADLSSFLGNSLVRIAGPTVPNWPLPGLQHLPWLGPILFQSNLLVYLSYLMILGSWFYVYYTPWGLMLRALGEQPAAAFARGANVVWQRYFYTVLGGALLGIAGAAFSLDFKAGWSHRHTAGYGWIALAIVIFGGWRPLRIAGGVYLFGLLQSLAIAGQSLLPNLPTQVLTVAPFAFMIVFLLLTSGTWFEGLPAPWRAIAQQLLQVKPPAALGKNFNPD